ncbi:MAG: hypothetical protein KJ043_02295 [Anaerolineae bacterium]|nr:hypothetical protein [Anaerolineae bacterium]
MIKFLFPLMLLAVLMVACTPTSDDETLPTRVVLPTDEIAIPENATEQVIDPLEQSTEAPIDPLENATEAPIDPLEQSTEAPIDPLENATEEPIDPLEQSTETVIDPLEQSTETVIDPLTNNNPPIVIPPLQETQPPAPTQSGGGLTVIMPTLDLSNLPTSVPTPTPYPLVDNFANLTESQQVIRITGTVEIFIEPIRDDDIYLLRDANGVAIELLWDYTTIDNIPGRGQIIEAIGTIQTSPYGHSALLMNVISIVPLSVLDESDM